MKINRITLENFGSYEGEATFETREQDGRNIILIGGKNGAGKTTLLRCITGMLRWKTGRSLLDGEDIRTMPERKLWRRMAYVPQAKTASSAAKGRHQLVHPLVS
mgnify:CR=1 FL=1